MEFKLVGTRVRVNATKTDPGELGVVVHVGETKWERLTEFSDWTPLVPVVVLTSAGEFRAVTTAAIRVEATL